MNYLALESHGWTREDFQYQSTREEWALRLGISVKTLYRYEKEVLAEIGKSSERLTYALYWRNRGKRYKLDYYQKFILWIIKMLSYGEAYADQKLSYEQIQKWFTEIDPKKGKKRILLLTPPIVQEKLGLSV